MIAKTALVDFSPSVLNIIEPKIKLLPVLIPGRSFTLNLTLAVAHADLVSLHGAVANPIRAGTRASLRTGHFRCA